MKRTKDKKGARAIIEYILKHLDELTDEAAAEFANNTMAEFEAAGGDGIGLIFTLGPTLAKPDPGRPEPREKAWADLLKDPGDAGTVERIITEEVQSPRDLAALVEAMNRRKLLNNNAGNSADVVRASAGLIDTTRAGSAKNMRENRQRYTAKDTGKITYFLNLLKTMGL